MQAVPLAAWAEGSTGPAEGLLLGNTIPHTLLPHPQEGKEGNTQTKRHTFDPKAQ